jgi:predicted PurR-regulated permease PerM
MKELRAITLLLAILVVFVIGVMLYELSSVLLPFVIALLLSFIFKALVLWLTRHRVPKGIALMLVLLLAAGVLFLVVMMAYLSAGSFVANLPKYQERLAGLNSQLSVLVQSIAERIGVDASTVNLSSIISVSTITTFATSSLGSFITFLSNAFLVFLFMLFLLAGSGGLGPKIISAFSESNAERIATIIANIDLRIRKYLVTKTIVNLGTGMLTTAILMVLGVDFAVFWGFLNFLLAYIPNIGSLIATIFPVLMALLQFDTLTRPILVLVLLIVAHNVMGNVVEPKLMQFSLNLSPVLILLSLIFWGWLWGIWGMILAIPITATIKIVCENVDALRPISVLMSGKVEAA